MATPPVGARRSSGSNDRSARSSHRTYGQCPTGKASGGEGANSGAAKPADDPAA